MGAGRESPQTEGMLDLAVRNTVGWMLVGVLVAWPARGGAQPSPEPAPPAAGEAARPWASGVTEAEQAIALDLYVAGNREFTESRYAQALAKYKEALQHWDHPAIRYNMAVCLINLDQPVEARDNLERSFAYGPVRSAPTRMPRARRIASCSMRS